MTEKTHSKLLASAAELPYENSGMSSVHESRGPGFFPGCTGLSGNFTTTDSKRVLVLGQDFGTMGYYSKINSSEGEIEISTTWRNLILMLAELDIKLEECFFTNAYMGLRENGKMTGPCQPALKSSPFSKACGGFLMEQLRIIRPESILVLGTYPARFVAGIWPDELSKWTGLSEVTKPMRENKFYSQPSYLGSNVIIGDNTVRFLFLLHPSMANTHRGLIWGKNGDGKAQEIRLLKEQLMK